MFKVRDSTLKMYSVTVSWVTIRRDCVRTVKNELKNSSIRRLNQDIIKFKINFTSTKYIFIIYKYLKKNSF